MNIPYVKKYNEDGTPIIPKGDYIHFSDNRKKRREGLQKFRFVNNRKSHPIIVHGKDKYLKSIQHVFNVKKDKIITIEHYILVK